VSATIEAAMDLRHPRRRPGSATGQHVDVKLDIDADASQADWVLIAPSQKRSASSTPHQPGQHQRQGQ
jgi:hypothetical protein